jgi:hypothetical protein
MIVLSVLLALAQDGAGSGSGGDPAPTDGAITTEDAKPLTLAPKPSPLRRVKPSGPTTDKYFPDGAGVTCEATIDVDKEGKATAVTMVSGMDTCPEPFQKACLRTMKYWKFLPAQMDGRAIAGTFNAKVTFHKDGTVDGADSK